MHSADLDEDDGKVLPLSKLVEELTRSIGRKLTAYIAGVKDVSRARSLDRGRRSVQERGGAFAVRVQSGEDHRET
jgi:hypothetical protein